MPATLRAVHLCPWQTDFIIGFCAHPACQWCVKARPARAAFELRGRRKQPLIAASTGINALALFVVQRAAIGPLGVLLAQYAVRRWRQPFLPLGIAVADGKARLGGRTAATAQDERSRACTQKGQKLALALLHDIFL